MKALVSRHIGGPDSLELADLPDPVPGPGELLIRVAACAINYPDVLMIEDKYQSRPDRPFAPGGEIAGTVAAIGNGVQGWSVGDRVIAVTGHGGLAELARAPADLAFTLPDGFGGEEGASFLLTFATTLHALQDRGNLRPGETLLVLGAAGGVGLAAIEIGRALGARVIAAVSDSTKADAARAAGAEHVVIYGRDIDGPDSAKRLGRQLKEAVGPDGADLIFDPIGGNYCEPAVRALAWGGRYLVIGFAAGIPKPPLNLILLKGADLRGVFWGSFAERDPAANRANVDQLLHWWREGKVRPRVGRVWPLIEGGQAIAWLGSRAAIGKAVVTINREQEA